jgi:hypothetical protein
LKALKRFLEYRHLPAVLAVGAILVMLPALKMGLLADDLPQRAVALKPSQLPPRLLDAGNPEDSGSFSTVIRDYFFGAFRDPHYLALAKSYGMLPWWISDNLRLGLWRPVTAFTHWLDYQLYPDSPALMHAQNIAWFAAILFLLTVIYRRLIDVKWVAGLAAMLFLLDGNTYFPVMFVANRGFMMALFFGLVCFYEHHQWRSTRSRSALVLSALFLMLSLFSNEGGASTLAFILAYALVMEPGSLRSRALTVLPAIGVIVVWRIIYESRGAGLHNMDLYIDPAHEPLHFARAVFPRALMILGSQIAQVPPELTFLVKPSLVPIANALYCIPFLAAVALFFSWLRRNKTATFWFAVMVLAAIPAGTVMPLSKNFGFVAVGAYGLIATFIAGLVNRQLPQQRAYRAFAWIGCIVLLIAHVPGAIFQRVVIINQAPLVSVALKYYGSICNPPDAENKHIVVLNSPCALFLAWAPAGKAYYRQPLPRSMRTLVPGCTSFMVERADDQTLVFQSRASNIFSCDLGLVDKAYGVANCNVALGNTRAKPGERFHLGVLTVEILQTDAAAMPSRVAFHFDHSLDSPDFYWLRFDWPTQKYLAFAVPTVGKSTTISGPGEGRLGMQKEE